MGIVAQAWYWFQVDITCSMVDAVVSWVIEIKHI